MTDDFLFSCSGRLNYCGGNIHSWKVVNLQEMAEGHPPAPDLTVLSDLLR